MLKRENEVDTGGSELTVQVNYYECSQKVRRKCIEKHSCQCKIFELIFQWI